MHSFVAKETAKKFTLVYSLEGVHVDGAGLTLRALSCFALTYLDFLRVNILKEYLIPKQLQKGITH